MRKGMGIASVVGSLILGGSILAMGSYFPKHQEPITKMVFDAPTKTYLSQPVVKTDNSKFLKELNQYKENETNYQNQIESLQHNVDSLDMLVADMRDENSKLALFANEYHNMNERYGNLSYNLEKNISKYLSKLQRKTTWLEKINP